MSTRKPPVTIISVEPWIITGRTYAALRSKDKRDNPRHRIVHRCNIVLYSGWCFSINRPVVHQRGGALIARDNTKVLVSGGSCHCTGTNYVIMTGGTCWLGGDKGAIAVVYGGTCEAVGRNTVVQYGGKCVLLGESRAIVYGGECSTYAKYSTSIQYGGKVKRVYGTAIDLRRSKCLPSKGHPKSLIPGDM